MEGIDRLKQEMRLIYREYQQAVDQFLLEMAPLLFPVEADLEPLLEELQQPLASFMAAYGVSMDEVVAEYNKGLH